MEDLLTGEKRKYFDPRLYINTLSGFLLAFIKMIESAAAAAGLILVLHRARLGALSLQELLAPLQQLSDLVPAVDLSWLPLIPLRYQLAITFVILVLTIMDGVGLLLIRTGTSGWPEDSGMRDGLCGDSLPTRQRPSDCSACQRISTGSRRPSACFITVITTMIYGWCSKPLNRSTGPVRRRLWAGTIFTGGVSG